MRFVCLVFLVVFVYVDAGHVWLRDLVSPKGWDLGYGVVLKLNESHKQGKNVPIMERFSFDLKLGDLFGVSVGKPRSDGIELDFYVNKNSEFQEGRRRKDDNSKYMMPMVIGYKAALAASAMLAIMKLMTLKALFLAKASLLISLVVVLLKLKEPQPTEFIEVEQHEYPSPHTIGTGGFHGAVDGYGGGFSGSLGPQQTYGKEAQSSNMYPDVIYAPSAAVVANPEQNSGYVPGSVHEGATQAALTRTGKLIQRKRDTAYVRKILGRNAVDVLSVKKYVSPET